MMFTAGSKTVQQSTSNTIMYLINYPEVAKKLQAEIDQIYDPIKDDPMNKLTYEKAEEFEYLRYCYNEALRIECPVSMTFFQSFSKTLEIEGVTIRKDENWAIFPDVIHKDPEQWQKPEEYIPERFNPDSPLFKRPDGGVRHPYAFTPFIGGARVCLGKNFADIMVRFTLSTLLFYYKFEFVNPEYTKQKPYYGTGASARLGVIMKKIQRNPLPEASKL
jgi:cytochrome P450